MRLGAAAVSCALLVACGDLGGEPSACDAIGERKMGITAGEYRPCAGEILAALDRLQPSVEAVLARDDAARAEAERVLGELRGLIRKTGFKADALSTRPGRMVERWPVGLVRGFNQSVFDATVHYAAVLHHPDDEQFEEGVKSHDDATSFYDKIR